MEYYPDPQESKPVVSSSPLKTASSAGTAPSKNLAASMSAYITKYCEVATGSRVVFQGYHSFAATVGWFRFKCKTCQDNWNMKEDMFYGVNSCPKELQDWLDKHKHVCDKFSAYQAGANPKCHSCGWGWNQHKAALPKFNIETGQWGVPPTPQPTPQPIPMGQQGPQGPTIQFVPSVGVYIEPYQGRTTGVRHCVVCQKTISVVSGVGICEVCYKAARSVHETKVVTVTQGRMFREVRQKEGTPCESETISQPISLDSVNSTTPVSKD